MTITFREPTRESLEYIAAHMCAEDLDELTACGWASPLQALIESVESSREASVAWWDGFPQAAHGVADFTLDPTIGVPWMLSTGPRGHIARAFVKVSEQFIADIAPMYSALFNLVDARHVRAQRWMIALGFKPYKVHDCNGFPFIEFGLFPSV